MTTERNIELHRVADTTFRENLLTEAIATLAREDTLLLEELESVCIEHLCPLIAIVASSIATREDVTKRATHIGTINGGQHLSRSRSLALESKHIVDRLGGGVVCHINHTVGHLADIVVCCEVLFRGDNFIPQLLGHLLASLVVNGNNVEEFGLDCPILQHLAGELHKVAIDIRTRHRLVGTLSKQAVQAVTKLVEEGLELIEGEERGSILSGFGEVATERDEGAILNTINRFHLPESGHPRTATLGCTGEEVHIENAEEVAILLQHLVSFHIGVVNLNSAILHKTDTIEPLGEGKDTLLNILQLEVGFHILLVVVEGGDFVFLAPISPVPRHKFVVRTIATSKLSHSVVVCLCTLDGCAAQLFEEVLNGRGLLCHTLFEHKLCVVVVAKQVCALQAELHNAFHIGEVVVLTTHTFGARSPPHLLLQLTIRGVGQEGEHTCLLEGHGPALFATSLSLGSHSLPYKCGQLCHLSLIGNVEAESVGCSEHILLKLQRERGEFLGDFPILLLLLVGEVCTTAHEVVIGVLQKFCVLLIEVEALPLLIYSLHPLPERRVEVYIVREGDEFRLHFKCQSLHLVACLVAIEHKEDGRNMVEQCATALHCYDSILEGGSLGIVHNSINLSPCLCQCVVERRHIVFQLYFRELGSSEGTIALFNKGVVLNRIATHHYSRCHNKCQKFCFHRVIIIHLISFLLFATFYKKSPKNF